MTDAVAKLLQLDAARVELSGAAAAFFAAADITRGEIDPVASANAALTDVIRGETASSGYWFFAGLDVLRGPPPVIDVALTEPPDTAVAYLVNTTGIAPTGGTSKGFSVLRPVAVTEAMLLSSSIPETTPEWSAGQTYSAGATVRQNGRCFAALQSGSGQPPSSSPLHWADMGPTNRWAMFDATSNTISSAPTDPLVIEVAAGAINAIALFAITGASVQIEVRDGPGGAIVYAYAQALSTSVISDWYQYFYAPVSASALVTQILLLDMPAVHDAHVRIEISGGGGAIGLGLVALGTVYWLGDLRYAPRVGIKDFSRKETDDFGNTTFVKRSFAQTLRAEVEVRAPRLNFVYATLADLRATPCVWIGSTHFEHRPLVLWGFYNDFGITVSYPRLSIFEIDIEGLT